MFGFLKPGQPFNEKRGSADEKLKEYKRKNKENVDIIFNKALRPFHFTIIV